MFCTKCGTRRQSHWQFCGQCGNNLAINRVVEEELPETLGAFHIDPSYDDAEVQTTAKPIAHSDDKDWTDYDAGSDFMEDDVLVTEYDMNEYERILEESGFNTLMKKLEEKNSQWKNVEINIAITGDSGCGKSTLINALRNMKADDVGAAKIGCTETTKEPTHYPFKENENVKIWELPGVGTPNFPKETYLKTIKFERYDFILLVSSNRYKENDTWLAKEITCLYPNSNLFFIRTKVDSDLDNYLKGYRTASRPVQRTIILKSIRDEIMANLTAAGIKLVKMFLINSHRPETFEYGKLQTILIEKVSALKRDAMILSLSSVSNNVVAEKIRVLESRIGIVSEQGAIATLPDFQGERSELGVLKTEVLFYKRQLGIDPHSGTWDWPVEGSYLHATALRDQHVVLVVIAIGVWEFDGLSAFRLLATGDPTFFVLSKFENLRLLATMLTKGSCKPITLDLTLEGTQHITSTTTQAVTQEVPCIMLSTTAMNRYVAGFGYIRIECGQPDRIDLQTCACTG